MVRSWSSFFVRAPGEFEDVAGLRFAEQGSSMVAGEINEMQVTGLLKTLQSPRHGQKRYINTPVDFPTG